MLQLKDGTAVHIADLEPTQGLAFALRNPGEAQMCKNPASCFHGVTCTFVHLKGTFAAAEVHETHAPKDRKDLEREREVLWNLFHEITRQFDECHPSAALAAELLKIYHDIPPRLTALLRQVALLRRTSSWWCWVTSQTSSWWCWTSSCMPNVVDADKKKQ
jgi:hypothetical protein